MMLFEANVFKELKGNMVITSEWMGNFREEMDTIKKNQMEIL